MKDKVAPTSTALLSVRKPIQIVKHKCLRNDRPLINDNRMGMGMNEWNRTRTKVRFQLRHQKQIAWGIQMGQVYKEVKCSRYCGWNGKEKYQVLLLTG